MKKIVLNIILAVLPLSMMAQLPYDTEMTESHFNTSTTVLSKTSKCSWSLGAINFGQLISVSELENYCVIALPTQGLPKKLYFQYRAWGEGTLAIYESTDHENWGSAPWTKVVKTEMVSAFKDSVTLKSSTRYLKIYFKSHTKAYVSEIMVTEKKELSVNIDEYQFQAAMVDDVPSQKSVTVSWTNMVANVTSSNPAFTVSTTKIGEKNKENQTTNLVISYNHDTYGTHSGVITIEGEGLKSTIAVSGTTNRYEQKLTWNQTLGTYSATDNLKLNAYTDYGLPVTYTSSDASIAWVDSLGNVHVECAGTVDFTAQQLGNNKYAPTTTITKSATFTKANPVISVAANDITYGETLSQVTFQTSSSIPGSFSFVGVNPDTIMDAGTYDLSVRFTPDNQCIYNSVDRWVTLIINKATQTITWNQEQTTLNVGETIELTAEASSGLDLTYAFTNCNIDIEDNQMTGTEIGDVLVIAFQPGNQNYLPTTVVMQAFYVDDIPTSVQPNFLNPSEEEIKEGGKKYYHDGNIYIYYRGKVYNAEGEQLK